MIPTHPQFLFLQVLTPLGSSRKSTFQGSPAVNAFPPLPEPTRKIWGSLLESEWPPNLCKFLQVIKNYLLTIKFLQILPCLIRMCLLQCLMVLLAVMEPFLLRLCPKADMDNYPEIIEQSVFYILSQIMSTLQTVQPYLVSTERLSTNWKVRWGKVFSYRQMTWWASKVKVCSRKFDTSQNT